MSSAASKVSGHLAEVGSVLLQALQTSFKLLRLQLLFFSLSFSVFSVSSLSLRY